MVVEAAPPAPFIVTQAEFLLELLIIALDPPAQFGQVDQPIAISSAKLASQYLVGSFSFSGHSISSHSSARGRLSLVSRWAARTRWRAKREDSCSALPSRQATICQASLGRLRASALALIGWRSLSRCNRVCGRPRPDRVCGSKGAAPGGQTVVVVRIPAT